jgi:hypothetical protein
MEGGKIPRTWMRTPILKRTSAIIARTGTSISSLETRAEHLRATASGQANLPCLIKFAGEGDQSVVLP